MAEMYKRFAMTDYPDADWGLEAAAALYNYESRGVPMPPSDRLNGFLLGKKVMDITVAMWKEDIPSMGLTVDELLSDGYPEWFLKQVGVLDLRPIKAACAWWMGAK
jgi:hypothetical protein